MAAQEDLRFLQGTRRSSPRFATEFVDEFSIWLRDKRDFRYSENATYWRNGFPSLDEEERHVRQLTGATEEFSLMLTTSGQAALTTVIETTSPTKGDIVVHGEEGYAKSLAYFQNVLADRKVRPVAVDTGSLEDIAEKLEKVEALLRETDGELKAISLEPCANGKKTSVLDVIGFLQLSVLRRLKPLIVIDNTLGTNSILPLASIIRNFPDLKIAGIESGTKAYISNEDNIGIAFTKDSQLAAFMQAYRRVYGSTPGRFLVEGTKGYIPPEPEQFDWENRRSANNTLTIAKACEEANGAGILFEVSHPGLPTHRNHKLAKAIRPPDGAVIPVFYINPKAEGLSAEDIAKALEKNGVLHITKLAESYGFAESTVLFEPDADYVRIAGGIEGEERIRMIADSYKQALSSL